MTGTLETENYCIFADIELYQAREYIDIELHVGIWNNLNDEL